MKILLQFNALLILCSIILCQIKKFVIKTLPNKEIDQKFKANLTLNKPCELKTGFVNFVKFRDNQKLELSVIKSYVTLDKTSISFFVAPNKKNLLNSILLKDIIKVTEETELKEFFCFNLIQPQKSTAAPQDGVILCAQSQLEKQEWINAIAGFKECKIPVQKVDFNEKLLVDFWKVDELLTDIPQGKGQDSSKGKGQDKGQNTNKGKGQDSSKGKGKEGEKTGDVYNINDLWYDNEKKFTDKPLLEKVKDIHLKKQVDSIVNQIKIANLKKNQIQRTMLDKINTAQKIKDTLNKQKEIIRAIIAKRYEKDKQVAEAALCKKGSDKEMKIINEVKNRIRKYKQQEIKQTKKVLENVLSKVKGEIKDKNKSLKGMIGITKKDTDESPCYDDRIKEQDGNYIQQTCKNYYGDISSGECEIERNFCKYCCQFHIGKFHLNRQVQCINKCNDLLCSKNKNAQKKKKEKLVYDRLTS